MEEKAVTSLSPFIIEKQIESIIGSPKSVKKLKNKTLLVEINRKSQTENLLKTTTFFGLRVSVTEHQSLNSSKGIIRDRMLKGEKEDEIVDYLKEQGVTACKRFKIKKDHETVETNTLLLTFNTVNVPKSLRIFYRIVPVDIYVPNPLRCFNCQSFGHHENNCPVDLGSVCGTAVREAMTIIPLPVKTRRNALTAAKTTFHDRATAKFGRKKRKFVKSR